MVGGDLSPGMLHAARGRAPEASLVIADATALPFRDAAADVTLAMHMLYHVPAPKGAVRELRRITRPAAIVALNGGDHLGELRDVVAAALGSLAGILRRCCASGLAWTRARRGCAPRSRR